MASQRQTEANRQNAQKSTGPRTPEGRARSCLNNLQTGIDSEALILPGEDPAAVELLRAEYYGHHQPISPGQRDTLDCIIHAVVLLRRFRALEAQTVHEMRIKTDLDPAAHLGHIFSDASQKSLNLQSRINSAERSFHRSLDCLEKLKSQRPPVEIEPGPEPFPQPPDTEAQNPELALNSEILNRSSGGPACAHPVRLEDCPNCRNLGYLSPSCHYILEESKE